MPARRLGRERIELELVDSTNRYLWQLLQQRPHLAEGTLVMAHHQYAGRGQRGASWQAEPGQNLTISLLLRPTWLRVEDLFALHKVSSLAVADSVSAWLPGLPVHVKWPNDVLINGRKVAGLLLENHLSGLTVETAVLGIGLNVNQTSFGPELSGRATSLAREGGAPAELEPLLNHLLTSLEHNLDVLRPGPSRSHATHELDRRYLSRLYRYQEWAPFSAQGQPFEGMIVGVTVEGRLALQMANRQVRYFDFKEVAFD